VAPLPTTIAAVVLVLPVTPENGTADAVMLVLHPKPVLVVQFSASAAAEQVDTDCAVGDADPLVALTSTVLVACVARSPSVTSPVAVNEDVIVGLAMDGDVASTTLPEPVVVT
jgi:hypothetical protein